MYPLWDKLAQNYKPWAKKIIHCTIAYPIIGFIREYTPPREVLICRRYKVTARDVLSTIS